MKKLRLLQLSHVQVNGSFEEFPKGLRIRGLNIFSVYALTTSSASRLKEEDIQHPALIVICNKSKGLRWIYVPSCWGIPSKGEDVIWLELGESIRSWRSSVCFSTCMLSWYSGKRVGLPDCPRASKEDLSQHNTDLNVIGGDFSELYLLIPGTYLLFGGPIPSCKLAKRLFGQSFFNFSGLIADLNAEADVDWQRLLFGEALDADAEVARQRLFSKTFSANMQRLLEAGTDWQRLFGEEFLKNSSGLIANSDVGVEVGNEDRRRVKGRLQLVQGESQALKNV
ncbi:hypothetical protein M0R45_000547 [Rubus argutus]|uniref:Uncharacterized protein n=1 Tax=Rubus argutus TaxID=59490 RepID=A0AAW1VME1_RUBAR